MLRLFARRLSHVVQPTGGDQVIFGVSLPSGSVVHDISAEVKLASIDNVTGDKAVMYACEGWILPVTDPDAAPSFDELWHATTPFRAYATCT